jgi:hypothetical protein
MTRRAIEIALGAALIAATVAYTLIYHMPAPYFDMWDLTPMFEAADAGALDWRTLFEIHGGHWHASAYAILIPLAQLTGWSHTAEAVATLLTIGAIALVLGRVGVQFAKEAAPQAPTGLFWLAPVFLTFGLDQSANLTWNFCFSTFLGLLGAVISLAAMTRPRFGLAHFIVAQVSAAVSLTSHAAGFAALPIGLVLILLRTEFRISVRALYAALWLLIGAAWTFAFYQAQQHSPFQRFSVLDDMRNPAFWPYLALFEIKFIGSAVARLTSILILPLAIIGPLAAIWAARFLHQRNVAPRALSLPLALCAFALGAGLMCGFGRFDFGSDAGANGRYETFAAIFWLGAAWLILAAISHVRSTRWRQGVLAALALCAVLKFASGVQSARKTAELTAPVAAIAEQMRDRPAHAAHFAREISRRRQDITRAVAFIQRKHWSVYRPGAQAVD